MNEAGYKKMCQVLWGLLVISMLINAWTFSVMHEVVMAL